jgi:hypothetical protein
MSFTQYAIEIENFINGLEVSFNPDIPTTSLLINSGTSSAKTSDGLSICQLSLPSGAGLDATKNGVNGLDTGSLGASKIYEVHIIGNPILGSTVATLLTLQGSTPLLPYGYSVFRRIGYAVTNGSSQFINFFTYGSGNSRTYLYGIPSATAITAGNATTFTAVDVSDFVPQVDGFNVLVTADFTGGAAGRFLDLQKFGNGSAGNMVRIASQVTSVVLHAPQVEIPNTVDTDDANKCKILYKVANSGDAVAISVAGFKFTV